MFDALRDAGFDIAFSNHAEAILASDFRDQTRELVGSLLPFRMPMAEIIGSGGGEAPSTQRLRRSLVERGWPKHNFVLETKIDSRVRESISHEIDHVRRAPSGVIALEIEWNNKDPFFDRDLENFQRLHAMSAISAGIIITRGARLQERMFDLVAEFLLRNEIATEDRLLAFGMKDRTVRQRAAVEKQIARGARFADAFARQFVSDKFGAATTHWRKLSDRVARGVGNPCPLLLIGLPASVVES